MKTLVTIQLLAKIGKVISKIIFIFCIVGFCGALLGITSMALSIETIRIGGVTLKSMVEDSSGMSTAALYAAMSVGIVMCAAEAVLCKFSEHYFKNELADGDPFTKRGAGELMRLGILATVLPLGTKIICSIGIAVARAAVPDIGELSMDGYSFVWLGIMLIVASLFCRYGADIKERKQIMAAEEPAEL